METWTYAVLFAAGLCAGFIDSIAGGGGLISVPVLFWCGLSPTVVLGTNKMQAVWGTLLAVTNYHRAGWIEWKQVRWTALITFVFAIAGTWTVAHLSPELLKQIIPWLLLAVALYTLASPKMRTGTSPARMSSVSFAWLCGILLGFYDGFFGPGAGSFWTVAYLTLLGYDWLKATAHTKVANLASNLASLSVFILLGAVRFDIALVMILGQLTGAHLGSKWVIHHGVRVVRSIFLAVVVLLAIKLLFN